MVENINLLFHSANSETVLVFPRQLWDPSVPWVRVAHPATSCGPNKTGPEQHGTLLIIFHTRCHKVSSDLRGDGGLHWQMQSLLQEDPNLEALDEANAL